MKARLELVNVDCGPTDCPVEERLELSMEFTLDRPLQHASWEIKVCRCLEVCRGVSIKSKITAQPGPTIITLLCHSYALPSMGTICVKSR